MNALAPRIHILSGQAQASQCKAGEQRERGRYRRVMETIITAVIAAIAAVSGGLIGRSAGLKTAQLTTEAARAATHYATQRDTIVEFLAAADREMTLAWEAEAGRADHTGYAHTRAQDEAHLASRRALTLIELTNAPEVGAQAHAVLVGLRSARAAKDWEPFKAARARLISTARNHLDAL